MANSLYFFESNGVPAVTAGMAAELPRLIDSMIAQSVTDSMHSDPTLQLNPSKEEKP